MDSLCLIIGYTFVVLTAIVAAGVVVYAMVEWFVKLMRVQPYIVLYYIHRKEIHQWLKDAELPELHKDYLERACQSKPDSSKKGLSMTTEEKLSLAIDLIRRTAPAVTRLANDVKKSTTEIVGKSLSEHKLEWAERELEHCYSLVGEFGPDPQYWHDAHLLSGEHWVLTEEGWEPAEGFDDNGGDIEILDEVNAPKASTPQPPTPG